MQSTTADLVTMISIWSGYCNLLCTTVAKIEKSQFLDFLKVFEVVTPKVVILIEVVR